MPKTVVTISGEEFNPLRSEFGRVSSMCKKRPESSLAWADASGPGSSPALRTICAAPFVACYGFLKDLELSRGRGLPRLGRRSCRSYLRLHHAVMQVGPKIKVAVPGPPQQGWPEHSHNLLRTSLSFHDRKWGRRLSDLQIGLHRYMPCKGSTDHAMIATCDGACGAWYSPPDTPWDGCMN